MAKIKFKSNYRVLKKRVGSMRSRMQGIDPEKLATESAQHFYDGLVKNLQEQGRGGEPPDLSSATRQIYSVDGEPDGSGLTDHIQMSVNKKGKAWVGTVSIAPGKPTLIAAVQESGATIPVTDNMRGFLAVRGIYLRYSTNYIYIPGRRFWSKARTDTKRFAKKRIRRDVLH